MKYIFLLFMLMGCTVPSVPSEANMSDEGLMNELVPDGRSEAGELNAGNWEKNFSFQADLSKHVGQYTLQFNIQPLKVLGTSDIMPKAEADISWSVNGNEINRRISLTNGATISGCGQAVRVVMRDVSSATLVGSENRPYLVTATLTKGTRASTPNPPILQPHGPNSAVGLSTSSGQFYLDAATPIADVIVPQGVGISSVRVTVGVMATGAPLVSAPIPEQDVQVWQLLKLSTAPITGTPVKVYDPRSVNWEPLAPGVLQLQLLNMNPTLRILFQVEFGIDG